jgi:hypothetical protein
MNDNGKGDAPRQTQDQQAYASNYDRIFGNQDECETQEFCVSIPEIHLSFRYVRATSAEEAYQLAVEGDYFDESLTYCSSPDGYSATVYDGEMNPIIEVKDGVVE